MAKCQGKTSSGDRCRREVGGDQFCHDHQPGESWDINGLRSDGTMTQADFARVIDRSRQRVNQYINQGILETVQDKRLDFADALDSLIARGDIDRTDLPFKLYEKGVQLERDADDGDGDGEEKESLNRRHLVAKVNHRVQQARLAKIKADKEDGLLIEKAPIERQWYELTRVTREQLMAIPGRLGGQLAGMCDEREIYRVLQAEIRQTLTQLSDGITDE